MQIYLIGKPDGTTKSRAIIHYLNSRGHRLFHSFVLYGERGNLLLRWFFKILSLGQKLTALLLSDLVFLLPMGRLSKLEKWVLSLLGKTLVSDFYISHYDAMVNDRKKLAAKSSAAQTLRQQDRDILRLSKKLIFLNHPEKRHFCQSVNWSPQKEKTEIIPLPTAGAPAARKPYFSGLRETMTVCWWGTYTPLHGLDVIIRSAAFLPRKGSIRLVLLGNSAEKSTEYQALIQDLQLQDLVSIRNDLTYKNGSLPVFLQNECDVALGNFGSSQKAKTVLVNKIVEAQAMALPVITQRTLASAEYYRDQDIVFCDPEPQKLAEAILDLYRDKTRSLEIAKNGGQRCLEFFSMEKFYSSMDDLMARI